MKRRILLLASLGAIAGSASEVNSASLQDIDTVVVIYAENRSFDNLYGYFPGANGLSQLTPAQYSQRDRDGSVLKELPPVWDGLTAKGAVPVVAQAQTEHLPNAPFAIDDPKGFNLPLGVTTRDLWHRFYQNQMQIAGGKNDLFAAYAFMSQRNTPTCPTPPRRLGRNIMTRKLRLCCKVEAPSVAIRPVSMKRSLPPNMHPIG